MMDLLMESEKHEGLFAKEGEIATEVLIARVEVDLDHEVFM